MRVLSNIVLTLALTTGAGAEDLAQQTRNSLKGLNGVRILINGIDSDLKNDGIDKDIIRTDIELELRRSGHSSAELG